MTSSEIPGELSGSHPLASWLNKLRRAVIARTPQSGPNYRLHERTTGFGLDIGPGGGGASVAMYRLKSVQDDHLTCRSWDGTTEGTSDIFVAKVHKLRHSITTETIETVVYLYTYETGPANTPTISNKVRLAKVGATEIERTIVTPEWLVNDLIYAVAANTGVFRTPGPPKADPVSLLMLGDGRAWAVKA